jgi:hypothetical protein
VCLLLQFLGGSPPPHPSRVVGALESHHRPPEFPHHLRMPPHHRSSAIATTPSFSGEPLPTRPYWVDSPSAARAHRENCTVHHPLASHREPNRRPCPRHGDCLRSTCLGHGDRLQRVRSRARLAWAGQLNLASAGSPRRAATTFWLVRVAGRQPRALRLQDE